MRAISVVRCLLALSAPVLLPRAVVPARAAPAGFFVLSETGATRDSLPVYRIARNSDEVARGLQRGFAGRLIRLYAEEQSYLNAMEGTEPEPAYLLLSGNEGGFPRFGFCLEDSAAGTFVEKPHAGYVDLHRRSTLSGSFGDMDQIYPHELMHVIVHQLAGERPGGTSNQVHAVGVCTDRGTAWDEGFAESCQVLAVDDSGADPATRALAGNARLRASGEKALDGYRREMTARLAFATWRRLGFLLWFSQTEQALRYYAVKENAFARAPVLPSRLTGRHDPYRAYLLENILPGRPGDRLKPLARLLSTEGVVGAFMNRWATDEALQNSYREDAFYTPFGVQREDVSPQDNVYLKLFHALHVKKPWSLAQMVRGYREVFPEEAPEVDRLVSEMLGDSLLAAPQEVWLANPGFRVGTSLFDQFRAMPRTQTFDLNAASLSDLMAVRGMRRPLAEAILERGPYRSIEELSAVKGMSPAMLETFRGMSSEVRKLESGEGQETESQLTVASLLRPILRRALLALAIAAIFAVLLYRFASGAGWPRSVIHGVGASLLGSLAGWFLGVAMGLPAQVCALAALGLIVLLFGVPATIRAAVLRASRREQADPQDGAVPARSRRKRSRRKPRRPAIVLAAWVLAGIPVAVLLAPWL